MSLAHVLRVIRWVCFGRAVLKHDLLVKVLAGLEGVRSFKLEKQLVSLLEDVFVEFNKV